MNNKLLEFKTKVFAKEVNDKIRQELKEETSDLYKHYDSPEIIKFQLCCTSSFEYMSYIRNSPSVLIELDQEDLEYFKKKYLPKMEDEYQANLAELNKKYNK